ncbi:hypothetical protein Tco_0568520 [Tanacetum coccineum]
MHRVRVQLVMGELRTELGMQIQPSLVVFGLVVYSSSILAAGYGGAQNRVGNANPGQARQIKCYNCNGGQDMDVDEDEYEQQFRTLCTQCG